jgi:membrane associated rhomboid family serine protease
VAEYPDRSPADARLARHVLAGLDAPGRLSGTPAPGEGQRASRAPLAVLTLIALNVVAYLLAIRGGGSLFGGPTDGTLVAYGAIPYELTHSGSHCALSLLGASVLCSGQPGVIGPAGAQPATWETVLTSMFVGAGLLRVAGAMVLLAFFGWSVEGARGRLALVAIYLVGGVVALAATVAVGPDSTVPALGASGALAALAGGYAALRADERLRSTAIVIAVLALLELPALAQLGAAAVRTGAATALWAHLAALAAGLVIGGWLRLRRGTQAEAARTE